MSAVSAPRESPPQELLNIASHLSRMALQDPERAAVVVPARGGRWASLSFAELEARSDAIARGLQRAGIRRGVRTVLMVRPSLDFFALVFALFKMGAVVVLIDPGIGRRALLRCLSEVEAEAFIGVPAAHVARLLFPAPFRKVKTWVTVGRRLFWGGHRLADLADPGPFEAERLGRDELAAILFTSGSTGIPKGAKYTHGIFEAQVRLIRDTYGIEAGETDVATFPPFALFGPALGMTVVVPEMDARFPAKARPERIAAAIRAHGASSLFASPALLDNLSRYGAREGIVFSTLRRVLSAGAPVRHDILSRMASCLPPGVEVHTPFGATEAMPVATIGSAEVLGETQRATSGGAGICVGRPLDGMHVRIIAITDAPIERWSVAKELPPGAIGEITVQGPVVTGGYWERPDQDRLSKIQGEDGIIHRMGDLGYLDAAGRLWMCGRKSHRVETSEGLLCTVPLEQIFNQHPAVRRSALVGIGERPRQEAALVVELEAGSRVDAEALLAELRALAGAHARAAAIRHFLVYPDAFPVDVRHNAKIHRESLATWASRELK